MRHCFVNASILIVVAMLQTADPPCRAAETPDFNARVLPVFRKYCNGCHNRRDAEGGLVLEDHARVLAGGDSGPAVVAGKSAESRLWQLLDGQDEPVMPPAGKPSPRPEERALIRAWIDAGAPAPSVGPASGLVTPRIPVRGTARQPVTALAVDPSGRWVAQARPQGVDILSTDDLQVVATLSGLAGQINDVSFSADGRWLAVGAGETGVAGEAGLWKTGDWSRGSVFRGHTDAVYAVRMSPDGRLLATAGYDRLALVWDVSTGQITRTLTGHNDAVFGLAFSPDGLRIATASGDRTVKLWDVASGQRLDTFSQPAKEQSTVAFSPDGRTVIAGGVDFRLRVWSISSQAREGTNPIQYARFAHEGPILKLVYSPGGRLVASASEDRLIKIWETRTFTQVAVLPRQPDWSSALSFSHDGRRLYVGRMNGELAVYPLDPRWEEAAEPMPRLSTTPALENSLIDRPAISVTEAEPNDEPPLATPLVVPATVTGRLQGAGPSDTDLFRFESAAGQSWIVETMAARSGSAADTRIEILHEDGRPVQRAVLQAVRDSWINFRPIDSSSPDVRVEFWEEMDLNQFLYLNGEICRTFRAPQGPDSGFQLYSLGGKRRNYFDTSATAHAKDEPCYVVEAYPPGSRIVENGLPVFPLYFSNDDDAERKLDRDSRLTFTAPAAGRYLVKVTDVRGFLGEKFHYTLTVRPPRPDFQVSVGTQNPKVSAGSGQRMKFSVNRIDGFEGEIRIDVLGLPAGFVASSPLSIPAGHVEVTGVLTAASDAPPPMPADAARVAVLATGRIRGELVTRTVGSLGEIHLEKAPSVRAILEPDESSEMTPDGALAIRPGATTTARIRVERHGFDGDVKFDVDNLPHGVIVDNIGLSGVLVRAGETQRQIFLTARPWVTATENLIHATAQSQGNQASPAVRLRVLTRDGMVAGAEAPSR